MPEVGVLLPCNVTVSVEHGRTLVRAMNPEGAMRMLGNPKLDELTQKVQSEIDDKKRNAMIHEAFKIHQDDVGHIPLHQQALAWATAKNVSLVQLPNNYMYFKWVTLQGK